MSELVVSGIVGHKQPLFVASSGPAHNSGASDGGLDDWDEGAQLALKNTVEII